MTSQKTPEPSSTPKRRQATTSFDRNHEFLMRCLLESSGRIDFSAVGKSHGITERSAKNRFYALKAQFTNQEPTSPTMGTTSQKKQQGRKRDRNSKVDDLDATPTKATGDGETRRTKTEENVDASSMDIIAEHKERPIKKIKKEEDTDELPLKYRYNEAGAQ